MHLSLFLHLIVSFEHLNSLVILQFASSDLSKQSDTPSQWYLLGVHCPFEHWNSLDLHFCARQTLGVSSSLFGQSVVPSHNQLFWMHSLLVEHLYSLSRQVFVTTLSALGITWLHNSSSDPSWQSFRPSHLALDTMHFVEVRHLNSLLLHEDVQFFSSDWSPQSSIPLHFQILLIQIPFPHFS